MTEPNTPPNPPQNPSLHADDEWKQQAQAEKERLAAKLGEQPAASPPPPAAASSEPAPAVEAPNPNKPAARASRREQLPPPGFDLIVQQYVTQAMLALGLIPHPATGKTERDLAIAQHYIDTLGVLREKTKGNLTKDEEDFLNSALYEVRMLYVDATKKG